MLYVISHDRVDLEKARRYPRVVLHVGSGSEGRENALSDDVGDSISDKNQSFCELTGVYWLWKNTREEYVGIEHYRRYFSINGEEEVLNLLKDYDVILPEKNAFSESVRKQYEHHHFKEDLDAIERIIGERYPAYQAAFCEVMEEKSIHAWNMMICKRELFDHYCEWLFDVLFCYEKQRKNFVNVEGYQKRVFGFLAERLLNVWVRAHQLKVREMAVNKRELTKIDAERYLACVDDLESKDVLIWEISKTEDKLYDVVIVIGVLERNDPLYFLKEVKKKIKPQGKLLLFCENRMALKYFAGDVDPYTGRFGDGLENYVFNPNVCGRCYSLEEIKGFLKATGFEHVKTYSVLPGIYDPKFVISEDYVPLEKMSIRYTPTYTKPDGIIINEEYIMDALFQNHMMPQMAGGLLFEITFDESDASVNEIILSTDRGRKDSMITTILKNNVVQKRPLYPGNEEKLDDLIKNHEYLEKRGIKTIPMTKKYVSGKLVLEMPYEMHSLANSRLQKLFYEDRNAFIQEMDRFRDLILQSSNIVEEKGNVLEEAFPDMVPLNCFYVDGEYVFFDQEFRKSHYPADAIITRSILIAYELDAKMEVLLPKEFFFERYGLKEHLQKWLDLSKAFTDELIHLDQTKLKDTVKVMKNTRRMDYSEEVWEKLHYNPIADLEDKVLYVYGMGKTAQKFIELYRRDYDIINVVTEDELKESVLGVETIAMSELAKLSPDDYRVVICKEDYEPIMERLHRYGAKDIVVYHPNKVYPGKQAMVLYQEQQSQTEKKPYHVGYVAGVFDLYHLGHLNMFKRAKAQCDYLIVGVVTDEGVRDFKKTEPFIPFEERVEMVRSCRYVDEVVEIPYWNRGTIEAFEKYHFDVQFSGSDYEKEPLWLYHKKWLQERGADMIFMPYTKQTSSTKIKNLIEKSLL